MTNGFSVGDYITDSSCIYQITATKLETDSKGRKETRLYFKPVWGSDKVFTGSIPVNNLALAGIRRVLTPKEAGQIMADLKTLVVSGEYTTISAKEEVFQNQPLKVASVLAYYWGRADLSAKADKDLSEQILEHFCHEVSLVTKKKYQNIKKDVLSLLNKRRRSKVYATLPPPSTVPNRNKPQYSPAGQKPHSTAQNKI